jgi:hypothetical protein
MRLNSLWIMQFQPESAMWFGAPRISSEFRLAISADIFAAMRPAHGIILQNSKIIRTKAVKAPSKQ